MPATCKFALTTFSCNIEREEGDNVSGICMEDLLVSSVCRSTDPVSVDGIGEVFDVVHHDVCWLAIVLIVLSASHGSNVGGQAGVNDDIVFSAVFGDWKASDHSEAVAIVKFMRDLAQLGMEYGQRESVLAYEAERLAQS